MREAGWLLARHTGPPIDTRAHDGTIAVAQSNRRWCSDGFEVGCDNAERVRVAFALDCCDREAMSWAASTAGIDGDLVRDLMVEAIEARFGDALPSNPIEWLSDNGSRYVAHETKSFAKGLNLTPLTTAIHSPQSNGMAESFVKTFKRDYVARMHRRDAFTAMRQLPAAFEPEFQRGRDPAVLSVGCGSELTRCNPLRRVELATEDAPFAAHIFDAPLTLAGIERFENLMHVRARISVNRDPSSAGDRVLARYPCSLQELQHRRHLSPEQRVARGPLRFGREFFEETRFAGDEQRDRHAVAVQHAVAGQRGQPRAGGEDADEVQRVGAADGDQRARALAAAHVAQQAHRFGRGELLAGHAGDEAAAADFAARLQAPIAAQQVAPRRQPVRFARHQPPEHDAVTAQQRARDVLDNFRIVGRVAAVRRRLPARERPAAGVFDAEQRRAPHAPAAVEAAAAVRGHQQRAQPGDAVGIDEPLCDQLGERFFDLGAQQARAVDDLVEERRAVRGDELQHALAARSERNVVAVAREPRPDAEMAAAGEHDRRSAHRGGCALAGRVQRRDARPHDAAGAREVVEPGRVVFVDARRQDLGFPCRRRRFEAFELRDDVGDRIGAFDARLGRDALPFEEEVQEVARLDRLDLLPQPVHGVAMDAREQAAFAPFARARRRREATAHDRAFGFERDQRGFDLGFGQTERRGEFGGRDRAETLQAVAQDFDERVFARPRLAVFGRGVDVRRALSVGVERGELGEAFGGDGNSRWAACRNPPRPPFFKGG
ncbi:DDE-type integrase/transposase/recombinase [Betaproteobacteria bacterium PRO7]|nr:DDE-type integrase/transposase/recombinase [Betaproteobacteria bacterium PRO7]